MVTQERMMSAFARHRQLFNERRRDEWLDNFVERPFIDEPADSSRRYGREHYAAIIDYIIGAGGKAHIHEPIAAIANGNELALHLKVTLGDSANTELHIIEIFTIAACGRVAGVRAFVPEGGLPPTEAVPPSGS